MCRVQQFCCGWTLRQGAITATILTLIGAIIYLIQAITLFVKASDYGPKTARDYRIKGGFMLLSAVLAGIICICLYQAIRKNRASLVLPWLICTMINIVLTGIYIILYLVALIWGALLICIYLGFLIYLWIIVFNFYKELQESSTNIPKV